MQLLSDAGERLWNRLITSVDDFGRLEADPEVVFTTCFQRVPKGWTAAKVAKCLEELTTLQAAGQTPLIQLYQVGPKDYLQILSAETHIYRRSKQSKYPDPPAYAPICAHPPADSLVSRSSNPELRTTNPEPRTSVGEPTPHGQASDRLESFSLTAELEAWAAKEGIHDPGQYLEEFKDYWRSTGGKRKNGQPVKDWAATFRNRLRMLKEAGKLKKKDIWA